MRQLSFFVSFVIELSKFFSTLSALCATSSNFYCWLVSILANLEWSLAFKTFLQYSELYRWWRNVMIYEVDETHCTHPIPQLLHKCFKTLGVLNILQRPWDEGTIQNWNFIIWMDHLVSSLIAGLWLTPSTQQSFE